MKTTVTVLLLVVVVYTGYLYPQYPLDALLLLAVCGTPLLVVLAVAILANPDTQLPKSFRVFRKNGDDK